LAPSKREQRFEDLFRENYGPVRDYALRRAAPDAAQDAVAETFLVAWRRLDDVPDDGLPWLYGVARRVLANQRRSASRGAALERRLAGALTTAAPADPGETAGDSELMRQALDSSRPAAERHCCWWPGKAWAQPGQPARRAVPPRPSRCDCTGRALGSRRNWRHSSRGRHPNLNGDHWRWADAPGWRCHGATGGGGSTA
jgi:hypothetical protein